MMRKIQGKCNSLNYGLENKIGLDGFFVMWVVMGECRGFWKLVGEKRCFYF